MMVITPVSPHTLGTRPLVIPATDTVKITATTPVQKTIDGDGVGLVLEAEIYQASCHAKIIRTSTSHFYSILRHKT